MSSKILKFPPPRRWAVEVDMEGDTPIPTLCECTGERDPVVLDGLDDPWLGATLEEIEGWAKQGNYGPLSYQVVEQIQEERRRQQ